MAGEYRIACFISSHGFGHAARTCAILNEAERIEPGLLAKLYTRVPLWFFEESLNIPFEWVETRIDGGLAQTSVFQHDVGATLQELEALFPIEDKLLDTYSEKVRDCRMVFSDVSALGLAVAERSGLKSVLFENFCWDWVYEAFLKEEPGFEEPIRVLREIYESSSLHIQSVPVCRRVDGLPIVAPVSRVSRRSRLEVREALGIGAESKLVLISRGGNPDGFSFLERLKKHRNTIFLFAGGVPQVRRDDNLLFLPFKTEFFHPDLVCSADLIVGKAGYSMIAEVWASGTPFSYILREGFRESSVLDLFLKEEGEEQITEFLTKNPKFSIFIIFFINRFLCRMSF